VPDKSNGFGNSENGTLESCDCAVAVPPKNELVSIDSRPYLPKPEMFQFRERLALLLNPRHTVFQF
jgi:hypothetical protein